MPTLKERLLSAEEDFLSALGEGDSALSAFESRWQVLIHDLDIAMESSPLDVELSVLVHATSLRISILADTSAELADSCNVLTSQLMDQVTTLMGDLTVTDHRLCPPQSNSSSLLPASHITPTPDLPAAIQPLHLRSHKRRREGTSDPSSSKGSPSKKRCRSPWFESDSNRCLNGVSSTVSFHPTAPLVIDPVAPPKISPSCRRPCKRRLSNPDVDIIAHPHQAKRVHVGPRLHAVSDSFVAHPVPKLEPTAASRSASASFALDSDVGWEICPLSTVGSRRMFAASNAPPFDSLLKPHEPHSSAEICDLDTFLQDLLAPLPPLMADSTDTPLIGSPITEPSTYGDVDSPLDLSPSPSSSSCPSTPPQEVAIEVFPPSYSVEDDKLPAVYGARLALPNITIGCTSEWHEWLDPLDPSVWLSAPPPPYSLGSSCLHADTPPSEIIFRDTGNAITPCLLTGSLFAS